MSAWIEHVEAWKDCQRCPLSKQRGRICIARGTVPADVVFVGEAPGPSEDALGLPFVGPAGRLLDQVIDSALPMPSTDMMSQLGLPVDTPYWVALDKAKEEGLVPLETVWVTHVLTNLVLCFPKFAKARGDNEPAEGEILACRPRLHEFMNVARPRLIVTVGDLAERYVEVQRHVRHVHITHPAAILRMPLAQKQMAAQRSVVVLRRAVMDMLGEEPTPWVDWEVSDADFSAYQRRARAVSSVLPGNDDIPFG